MVVGIQAIPQLKLNKKSLFIRQRVLQNAKQNVSTMYHTSPASVVSVAPTPNVVTVSLRVV